MARASSLVRATSDVNQPLINNTVGHARRSQILRLDTLSTGYTAFSSSGTHTHTIEAIDGMDCAKLTTPVGDGTLYSEIRLAGLGYEPPHHNARIMFVVYCDRPDLIDEIRLLWGETNYVRFSQAIIDQDEAGTNRKRLQVAGWSSWAAGERETTTSFLPATDTLNDIKIRVKPVSGSSVTFYTHSVWLVGYERPKFVIGFDDNLSSVTTAGASVTLGGVAGTYSAEDILDYYGFKGTLYVVTEFVDDASYLTKAELKRLYDKGWDIQAQCHWNASSLDSTGQQLLGPYGYQSVSVLSVDATANTITTTAAHNLPTATLYVYPIVFSGTDLPAPLVVDTEYFARATSTTAFTLHPTAADSLANTNAIDLTTTGTAANFTYRYSKATNDTTAIDEDYDSLDAVITSAGIPAPKHIAVNQGALDRHVYTAIKNHGYKTIRTTLNTRYGCPALFSDFDLEPLWMGNTIQVDSGVSTQAQIEAFVRQIINDGSTGHSYCHAINDGTAQSLIHLCDYLSKMHKRNLIDVVTISEYHTKATV